MKVNTIKRKSHLGLAIAVLAVLAAAAAGLIFAYGKLRDLYLEQCVITDMARQVTITTGKMVKPDVIAENLGLRPGANLATIDFAKRREDLLKRVPNLLSIRISRKLPDRVIVTAEERTPVARLMVKGSRSDVGRVVDTEGVVFLWQRGTQSLPVIREAQPTPRGDRIRGRTLAALRLVEACREPEFLELGVLDVDTQKHDFLTVTLGNYSRVKILWEGMDEQTPDSKTDLLQRLDNLRNTIRSNVSPATVIWNATIPNRIFADRQEVTP